MFSSLLTQGSTFLSAASSQAKLFEGFGLKEIFTIFCILVAIAETAILVWGFVESR